VARHGPGAALTAVGYQNLQKKTPMRTDSIDLVEKYLPEFHGLKLYGGAKPTRLISIRDLMTHTSGLPGETPKGFVKADHTLAEVVSVGAQQQLENDAG
jgi:hypothetical protein